MADKERRSGAPTRRTPKYDYMRNTKASSIIRTGDRRIEDFRAGRLNNMSRMNIPEDAQTTANLHSPHGGLSTAYGVVDVKEKQIRPERRIGGAGRRAGDLARALETGESVIFQVGKGVMKNAGKLAEKVIKKKLKLGP